MKKIFFISLLFVLAISCKTQKIEVVDGKYYQSKKLYNGIYSEYNKEGVLLQQTTIKDGLPEGKTTIYFNNGKIKEE